MTQITRHDACYAVSPGCPCPEANAAATVPPYVGVVPGPVSNIVITIGSVILSWNAPTTGDGPFVYKVTPSILGVAQKTVTTAQTTYRFTDLDEFQPYTFTIVAENQGGQGPPVSTSNYVLAPPKSLTAILEGSAVPVAPEPSLKYIINEGLDRVMQYVASAGLGPTRGSRFMYVWICSVVGAWNWITSEQRIAGTKDNWNWDDNKIPDALTKNEAVLWLSMVIDEITPSFVPGPYTSIYKRSPQAEAGVKQKGDWNTWKGKWVDWKQYRDGDGSATASTQQPNIAQCANIDKTIVVDGQTVTNIDGFPEPQDWTPLTVLGKKQKYLTCNWMDVLTTCLTPQVQQTIVDSVSPLTGAARDAEVDEVKEIAAGLTNKEKIIAEFWAGGPGTVSPPLMFIWMWKEYMRVLTDVSCDDVMYSLQDLAIHLFEGGRVTWGIKLKIMEDRPIQEIRRRFEGQEIDSWNGKVDGAQWIPYQEANFVTPPFGDFTSGHSNFSMAFALTMKKWFGETIQKAATFYDKQTFLSPLFAASTEATYGDFTVLSGRSQIEPGVVPSNNITLSFDTWEEMADSAGISRLYGGIHCESANEASKEVAREVDIAIQESWDIQTGSA
jgi:hypothetical protein